MAFLLVVTLGCQKDYETPLTQSGTTGVADARKKPAKFCPVYFYYYYGSRILLGEINNSQIIIGFQATITETQKEDFLKKDPYLQSIKNAGTTGSADATVVILKPGLTCSEVEAALNHLAKAPEVLYATPFFKPSADASLLGITNQFMVNLKPGFTIADLQKFTKRTKTHIVDQLGDITFILSADKYATGNALQMANEFNGFYPVASAEPDFYYEF